MAEDSNSSLSYLFVDGNPNLAENESLCSRLCDKVEHFEVISAQEHNQ
jgi:hypothetical protein